MYTATERLYLTQDGKTVVKEGDVRGRILLIGKGGQLSDEEAEKYGLLEKAVEQEEPAAPVEAKAQSSPPAHKAVLAPPEDKTKKKPIRKSPVTRGKK